MVLKIILLPEKYINNKSEEINPFNISFNENNNKNFQTNICCI
jgi:hypothetical protein